MGNTHNKNDYERKNPLNYNYYNYSSISETKINKGIILFYSQK